MIRSKITENAILTKIIIEVIQHNISPISNNWYQKTDTSKNQNITQDPQIAFYV